MQNTINYNLKKPDYTDFADIKDINDNMDKIDEELAAPTGDTADSTATFTCSDVADGDAAAWTTVPALTSGETHKSLFAKMSQMFKNLRYLYKLLGTTDISSIGNGTVTGGLSSLNDSFASINIQTRYTYNSQYIVFYEGSIPNYGKSLLLFNANQKTIALIRIDKNSENNTVTVVTGTTTYTISNVLSTYTVSANSVLWGQTVILSLSV